MIEVREANFFVSDLSLNGSQLSRQPSLSSEKGTICRFGVPAHREMLSQMRGLIA